MSGSFEASPTSSPEQAVRSFREDLLAGTGFEHLIDSAAIHYERYGEGDFADITATAGDVVTFRAKEGPAATIYSANEVDLLATDENYAFLRVCPPEEVADFIEALTKRSPGSERVTLEIDISPEQQPGGMQKWSEIWDKEDADMRQIVGSLVAERVRNDRPLVHRLFGVGDLTERYYPLYIEGLKRNGIDPEAFGFPESLDP